MPPIANFTIDWMKEDGDYVQLDCLLPTGIIVPLKVEKESTLGDIKESLWKEAQAYPLFSSLKSNHTYVFQCITSMAEKVELEDETQHLFDIKLFQPILKVVERIGNSVEKIETLHINMLIGKALHEFDQIKSTEISDFRQKMRKFCEDVAKKRDSKEWLQRLLFLYPTDLADSNGFPKHIRQKLTDRLLIIGVHMPDINIQYTFRIQCSVFPYELISMVINKRNSQSEMHLGDPNDYVLKICGREEFLIGDYPMSKFMYIRRSVNKDVIPTVILLRKEDVLLDGENMMATIQKSVPKAIKSPKPEKSAKPEKPQKPVKPMKGTSLWHPDLNDKPFSFKIHNATNVCESNFSKSRGEEYLQLSVCIYHGPDSMANCEKTREVMLQDRYVSWEEDVTFDINVSDIPRMARLCFVLSSMYDKRVKGKKPDTGGTASRKKGRKEYSTPVAWVNIALFDYKDILRNGPCTLYMWEVPNEETLSDRETMLNPIGTVENNPMSGSAVCLKLTFQDFGVNQSPIYYPPFEKVLEVAASHTDFKEVSGDQLENCFKKQMNTIMLDERKNVNQQHLEKLREMIEKDPLTQLHEQEKEKIWMLRYECQHHFPESLPKLLRCVNWNNRQDVAQMQALLQIWPKLEPQLALELLDFDHADKSVRRYAVKCLEQEGFSDRRLNQYLLQLVQVLKYESYVQCDLVEFLLERALNNRRIGHSLFWLLRAEMQVPSVSVRFGLILEAFLRGSGSHMDSLKKQVMALDKLKFLGKMAKEEKHKDDARKKMRKFLAQSHYSDAMSDLQCTLDPGQKLKCPIVDSCKVMDSKMRPLWLEFENKDLKGEDVSMMYKNGDDLRQDMLTLQMLRIIDSIWQDADLDLRLNAYGCMSTADKEGLIEIVTSAKTIANIQKENPGFKISSAFRKQSLYEFIKKNNTSDEKLEKAVDEFTRSCAGYSVAMYVLGVGDRHGDNILLKENGQLVHIDFGHFLGHFKSKYGINREPSPLLLTSEFVYLIQRGPKKDNKAFESFKETCEKAYMALREKSSFLITLFLMMMNTGIPELSSTTDIEFLKKTLQPQLKEAEAKEHFRKQINVALKNSWKVAFHNTLHNLTRDNN